MSTLCGDFDLPPQRISSLGHMRWREKALIRRGIPAFISPFVDVPVVEEHRLEMLYRLPLAVLSGRQIVGF